MHSVNSNIPCCCKSSENKNFPSLPIWWVAITHLLLLRTCSLLFVHVYCVIAKGSYFHFTIIKTVFIQFYIQCACCVNVDSYFHTTLSFSPYLRRVFSLPAASHVFILWNAMNIIWSCVKVTRATPTAMIRTRSHPFNVDITYMNVCTFISFSNQFKFN